MKRRRHDHRTASLLGIVCFLTASLLCGARAAWAEPVYTLSFAPDPEVVTCDGVIVGHPGQKVVFDVIVELTNSDNQGGEGPSGWSLSIHGENVSIIETEGGLAPIPILTAPGLPAIVDPLFMPTEGPLVGAPQGPGVVDGAAGFSSLPPNGTAPLIRLGVEVTIPSPEEGDVMARLAFVNGKQNTPSGNPTPPALNEVVVTGDTGTASIEPDITQDCTFTLRPTAGFKRGDTDGSGKVGLNDAIQHLTAVFLGTVELPCPDASDADDDGRLSLQDALVMLYYSFLGTDTPAAPGPLECGPDTTPADPPLGPCVYPPEGCGS